MTQERLQMAQLLQRTLLDGEPEKEAFGVGSLLLSDFNSSWGELTVGTGLLTTNSSWDEFV